MLNVDLARSFLVIVVVAALAAFAAGMLSPRFPLPVVVLEIVAGIVVGPQRLDLPTRTPSSSSSRASASGCSSSSPATRSTTSGSGGGRCGWRPSGGSLADPRVLARRGARARGDGALAPIHRLGAGHDGDRHVDPHPQDAGESSTRPPRHFPRGGGRRRVRPDPAGPLVLSAKGTSENAAHPAHSSRWRSPPLWSRVRGAGPGWDPVSSARSKTSSQLPVRLAVVLVFGAGPRVVPWPRPTVGGFVTGIRADRARGREVGLFESSFFWAVGYGFFIPFSSRPRPQVRPRGADRRPATCSSPPLFFALFLV